MTKLFEFIPIKCFNKIINYLFVYKNVFKIHIVVDNLISYLIMLNVNVFNSFIILKVFNESDNVLIVVENNDRLK